MSKRGKSETESDSESEWFRPRKQSNLEHRQNVVPIVSGQYTCNVCQKNYNQRQTLVAHKKKCTGPKPKHQKQVQCKYCKKKISLRQSLYNHGKLCKGDSTIKEIPLSSLRRKNTENEGAKLSPKNTENEGAKFSPEKEEIVEEIEREIVNEEEKDSDSNKSGESDPKNDNSDGVNNNHFKAHPYICNNSGVEIRTRRNFIKHVRSCQAKQLGSQKCTRCYFPDCDSKFYHKTSIIKHLNEKHFQNLEIETFQFENEDEFKEFKKERDMEYYMSTVKHCGSSKNKDETVTYEYFHCNFDVQNRKKGKSLIPNTNCPARLLIKKTNDCHYEVKFIKYHTHEIEEENLKYHRYPKECLNYLKTMLAKGFPPRTLQEHLVPSNVHDLFPIKEHFLEVKEIRDLKNRMEKKTLPQS